jgi:4-alpha-glucanotransferase
MTLRSSGILLHLTSLPSEFGIGDLGPQAYRFVSFLHATHQHCWQILPLTPTESAHNHSPYHSISAHAGNPLLISPRLLVEKGWLTPADLTPKPAFRVDGVDFAAVQKYKQRLFTSAYARFAARKTPETYRQFCRQNPWLGDYALFKALKAHYGDRSWTRWPAALRNRRTEALQAAAKRFEATVGLEQFLQFIFFEQWRALQACCRDHEVQIIGDVPIYVPLESAEVWTHPHLFMLGADKKPQAVSGVPPDYFSRTGQLWGHPVYRWPAHAADGYRWWIDRLGHNLKLFDRVRLDHFRGFVGYWQVPAAAKSAVAGHWVPAPADDFLRQLSRRLPTLPLIAEDLGCITPDVRETMHRFALPGMRVLLFAFGDDFPEGAFLPHNYVPNCVAYTGTHDNNTIQGWFKSEAGPTERRNLFRYLGGSVPASRLHWQLIRLVMMSVADTAIIPLQDLLGLGEAGRMNRPARLRGNWRWRLRRQALNRRLTDRLRELTITCGRA